MNPFLHNIGDLDGEPRVDRADALIAYPGESFDYVQPNPAFGKKSSMTITNKDGRVHTQGVWIYDFRTNQHFTLKTKPLKSGDLHDFIACYHPENRQERQETERFRYFATKT
jgi:type I restriction-modification system DNA methylase subunit